jgi:hypothetical protein
MPRCTESTEQQEDDDERLDRRAGHRCQVKQPETVPTLLRQLGVRGPCAVQEANALRAWLGDNVPNPALRMSFRRNGYGFLLGSAVWPLG